MHILRIEKTERYFTHTHRKKEKKSPLGLREFEGLRLLEGQLQPWCSVLGSFVLTGKRGQFFLGTVLDYNRNSQLLGVLFTYR